MYYIIFTIFTIVIVTEYICRMLDIHLLIRPSNFLAKVLLISRDIFFKLGYWLGSVTDIIGLLENLLNKIYNFMKNLLSNIKKFIIELRKILKNILQKLKDIWTQTPLYDAINLASIIIDLICSIFEIFRGYSKYFYDLIPALAPIIINMRMDVSKIILVSISILSLLVYCHYYYGPLDEIKIRDIMNN